MYLKLFQALGGLGLLLGVGVVALVVVRNAWDRQGELALLRAVGFSRRNVAGLLVGEQVWLVGWGMAAGVLMALAVVAFVLDASRLLSAWWPGPLIMLVMVAMGGVLSSALAAWAVTGSTPWNALRRE
jgi:ABC-type antimicrobial peptide transport system permease subunit